MPAGRAQVKSAGARRVIGSLFSENDMKPVGFGHISPSALVSGQREKVMTRFSPSGLGW
jgi:hypothetical protein